jgi:hypothetical protein
LDVGNLVQKGVAMLRRKPIRRKSRKRARLDRAAQPEKLTFRQEHSRCWNCKTEPTSDVHHIAGRRGKEFDNRANWCALCADCHALWTDNRWQRSGMDNKAAGVLVALALKHLHDREHFDLALVLRVWGRAETCLTLPEVMAEVRDIRRERGIAWE